MSDDLEALLKSTEAVGELTLLKLSGGWRCSIDIPAPTGCQAEISSDFNCSSPTGAVRQALDRLNALRRSFSPAEAPKLRAIQ